MPALAAPGRTDYNIGMIVIYTALYHEAKPIIESFRLHKAALPSPVPGRIQWFAGTPERLGRPVHVIIGGTGPLAAAVGTAYALTRLLSGGNACGDDAPHAGGRGPIFFLNLGIAGSRRADWPQGTAVLCHKIIHHDSGRAYYPDVLLSHPFREGVLETFSHVVGSTAENGMNVTGDLADMEGAGCFEAAAAFLPPHRTFFVKIVSDHLHLAPPHRRPADAGSRRPPGPVPGGATIDGKTVSRLVSEHIPAVERLLLEAQKLDADLAAPLLKPEEEALVDALSQHWHLSVTMSHQLRQLCLHYKAMGGQDLAERLRPYLARPVQSKQESKAAFDRLRRLLLPG